MSEFQRNPADPFAVAQAIITENADKLHLASREGQEVYMFNAKPDQDSPEEFRVFIDVDSEDKRPLAVRSIAFLGSDAKDINAYFGKDGKLVDSVGEVIPEEDAEEISNRLALYNEGVVTISGLGGRPSGMINMLRSLSEDIESSRSDGVLELLGRLASPSQDVSEASEDNPQVENGGDPDPKDELLQFIGREENNLSEAEKTLKTYFDFKAQIETLEGYTRTGSGEKIHVSDLFDKAIDGAFDEHKESVTKVESDESTVESLQLVAPAISDEDKGVVITLSRTTSSDSVKKKVDITDLQTQKTYSLRTAPPHYALLNLGIASRDSRSLFVPKHWNKPEVLKHEVEAAAKLLKIAQPEKEQ